MDRTQSTVVTRPESVLATNKVLRNTYALLSMTLVFSAAMAGLSMVLNMPPMVSMGCSIAAIVLLWFVLPRYENSSAGIGLVFLTTGLLGFGLGPILTMYMSAFSNGSEIVMLAMGGTAVIFLGLSGYALTSRRDFGFLGPALMVGILVAFVAGIANIFFGFQPLALAVSSMFMVLMAGLMLYQTSEIVHGRETNYIRAAITFYVSIYNMFSSLLHLLGMGMGED